MSERDEGLSERHWKATLDYLEELWREVHRPSGHDGHQEVPLWEYNGLSSGKLGYPRRPTFGEWLAGRMPPVLPEEDRRLIAAAVRTLPLLIAAARRDLGCAQASASDGDPAAAAAFRYVDEHPASFNKMVGGLNDEVRRIQAEAYYRGWRDREEAPNS